MTELEKAMEEYQDYGYLVCPECSEHIEIDLEACQCGWENPVYTNGMV